MQINRQTYEEFFLLYNDGELTPGEMKAVEEFVRENPDLEQELFLLQETVFTPDESVVFDNKEELYRYERKVVALPWFRIAAAAAVVIALSIAGWLYLGSEDEIPGEVLASKELVRDEDNNRIPLNKVEPTVTTVSEDVETPSEKIVRKPAANKTSVILTVISGTNANVQPRSPNTVRDVKPTTEDVAGTIKPEPVKHELAAVNLEPLGEEVVDEAVAPLDVEKENTYARQANNTTVEYVEAEEDNMIYFANTTLPKKSKFRGVFRKATRFLDKVTSLQ